MNARCWRSAILGLLLWPGLARTEETDAAKVLDRFVGAWRNDVSRIGPEAPQRRKFTTNEVIARALQGRYLIGRDFNAQSGVRTMWFMTYDPQAKNYAWTFFNTQGLLGTEWKGTWDEASSTLSSKSSDAPANWTSEAVNRFVDPDKVEAQAWMRDERDRFIFEMSLTKTRLPATESDQMLTAWTQDAAPAAQRSAELKVLDFLEGTWDVVGHFRPAEWTPKEVRIQSKVVRSWVLNHTFLQDHSIGDDGRESLSLFTYDPKQGRYRAWWFSSEGYTTKSTAHWDAAQDTLHTESKLPDGLISTGSVHRVDQNQHVWKLRTTDAAGKVYFDCDWTCVRAKS